MPTFRCAQCDAIHEGPPLSYGVRAPDAWDALPKRERKLRAVLTDERCVIDGEHHFVKGNVRIPIVDGPSVLDWTVWVSLSGANFARAVELWNAPGRESEPGYFGWLSNLLPAYPSTINLRTTVHTQPVGVRPLIELEASDHPLAIEQRKGITMRRVQEIAEQLLHGR